MILCIYYIPKYMQSSVNKFNCFCMFREHLISAQGNYNYSCTLQLQLYPQNLTPGFGSPACTQTQQMKSSN